MTTKERLSLDGFQARESGWRWWMKTSSPAMLGSASGSERDQQMRMTAGGKPVRFK